jgi:hypothetical protein
MNGPCDRPDRRNVAGPGTGETIGSERVPAGRSRARTALPVPESGGCRR